MKILVPVKRVVDPYSKLTPSSDGLQIDLSGAKYDINPFDEIALEEAVQIKERTGAEVVAVAIGVAQAEEQLRKALAMGADRAILIESAGDRDSLSVAKELAILVRSEGADLVLMGKQATDDDNNQAGQMLAAILDWPQATFASKIVIEGNQVEVTRETDSGEQTVKFSLPGLVTADLRLNQPRYIALPGIIKARGKPLEKRAPATSEEQKVVTVGFEAPPKREAGRKVGSVQDLASAIKGRGALS